MMDTLPDFGYSSESLRSRDSTFIAATAAAAAVLLPLQEPSPERLIPDDYKPPEPE
jgi:hypothetical protein